MLKYIENHEIDIVLWDDCISRSSQSLIYAMSWYLDIVSPGWAAIVEERKGKYILAMPLTIKKKLGIPYLIQPILAQQLGAFSLEDDEEKVCQAINDLKNRYFYINYNFNSNNVGVLQKTVFSRNCRNRITYMLKLNQPYQQLMDGYTVNNKRNIKKALRHGLAIKQSIDFIGLVELFRKMKGLELAEIRNMHYDHLIAVFNAAKTRDSYILCNAIDKNNNVLAGALFLVFQKKIIYVLGASTPEGKEKGAMNLIIDEVIREYADGEYLLDFEGGESDGIGRFYKGFGGKPVNYTTVEYNRLSFK